MEVYRTIKYHIKKTHPDYNRLKQQCVESKEIYNFFNYALRQLFFKNSPSGKKYNLDFIYTYPELTPLFEKWIAEGAFINYQRLSPEIKEDINHMFTLFPRLAERKKQLAGTMSGGEQQMLAMARALMSSPSLLLLDEPSMGLAPLLVQEIFNIIERINKEENVTVLLVEQNANMALSIADRGYVLETGKIILEGTGKELLSNPEIKKAYLGG